MRYDDRGNDGENDEYDGGDLRDLRQLGINALRLALAKEGIRSARDGTKALTLSLLHQHGHDQNEGEQNQKNVKNNGQCAHGSSSLSRSAQHTCIL